MKKLFLIALALVTIQVSAQNKKEGSRKADKMEKRQGMSDFSPEEIAQLQTKQMTLDLDLTASQQKQIEKIHLENAKERQALRESRQAKAKDGSKQKPTKEERLAMMNERLDRQIEMKKKMKQILTPEQFEKWEKTTPRRGDKSNKKSGGKRDKKNN